MGVIYVVQTLSGAYKNLSDEEREKYRTVKQQNNGFYKITLNLLDFKSVKIVFTRQTSTGTTHVSVNSDNGEVSLHPNYYSMAETLESAALIRGIYVK